MAVKFENIVIFSMTNLQVLTFELGMRLRKAKRMIRDELFDC